MNRQTRRFEKRSNRKPRAVRKAMRLREAQRQNNIRKTKNYVLKKAKQELPALFTIIALIIVNILSFATNTTVNAANAEIMTIDAESILEEEHEEKFSGEAKRFSAEPPEIQLKELQHMAGDEKSEEAEKTVGTGEAEEAETVEVASEEDVLFLSRLIVSEVGMFYTTLTYEEAVEAAILTGGVVRNRMVIKQLSLEEIVYAPGQYADPTLEKIEAEVDPNLWDESVIPIARAILEYNEDEISMELIGKTIKIPEDLYYQAQNPLGSGTYRIIGEEYFCYK